MSGGFRSLSGQCLCASVKFELTLPPQYSCLCSCNFCLELGEVGAISWLGTSRRFFNILSGEKDLRWFKAPKSGVWGYCKSCGAPLFWKEASAPRELHVTTASITGDRFEGIPRVFR